MQDRMFAIDDHEIPSIPWSMIAPHEAAARARHGASLDVLDRRGGLTPAEVVCVIDAASTASNPVEARAQPRRLVAEHRAAVR